MVQLKATNILLMLIPPAFPDSTTLLEPAEAVQRLQHTTWRNQTPKTKQIKKNTKKKSGKLKYK